MKQSYSSHSLEDALLISRIQFAFTVMYHYLFPQLTMGLGLLLVVLKTLYHRTHNEIYTDAARFWIKIYALNFAVGVITGVPMEFQFGTNWARFARFAGGVIGQTLAMEGMFAFFLESSFLGLLVFGEKRFGERMHYAATILVFLGSWISGYFITATNAWMQHPVAFERTADGFVQLTSFWGLLLNPWLGWQYMHTMIAAVVTGSFVMSALGAYYLLSHKHEEFGKIFLRIGLIAGLVSTVLVAFPSGDAQIKNVYAHQPVTFAAMEGVFETKEGVELVLIGQPDMDKLRIDNPLHIPYFLSFLTHFRWNAGIKGLQSFPKEEWPTNIPLLYYSYHVMVGLGTMLIALSALALVYWWRGKLFSARWLLWALMLAFPFPYIANTAGWMTAELGRQPWLVYGIFRTAEGNSHVVSAGNGLFTLLGFLGMYFVIGVMYLALIAKKIDNGPERHS